MGFVFLGVATIPFAILAYLLYLRLAPTLLEVVPEPSPEVSEQAIQAPERPRLWGTVARFWRAALAVVVLLLAASAVVLRPDVRSSPSTVPHAAVQGPLPPAVPIAVEARFGSAGAGPGQLQDARDLTVDAAGNIYVADAGNRRVVKFGPDGTFALQWDGPAGDKLVEPAALVAVKDGVVVADAEAGRLYKYDFEGKLVQAFEQSLKLSHPRGLAVDGPGTVYVADTANNRVLKLSAAGALVAEFPKLDQPAALAVDERGAPLVVQPDSSRVDRLAPTDGTLQARWFVPRSVTVYPPRAVWLEGKGLLATAPDEGTLLSYAANGNLAANWRPEVAAGGLVIQRPIGLAFTPDRRAVWVLWNVGSVVTRVALPA